MDGLCQILCKKHDCITFGNNMTTKTYTHYTVSTHVLREHPGAAPYWAECGSGPGGYTIDQARKRLQEEIVRVGSDKLDNKVKFIIKKTVEVTEIAEEVLGSKASFFLLKG